MLEKTFYLTSLYLSADKTALAVQVLAAILPALLIGLTAFRGRTFAVLNLAGLQLPLYVLFSKATDGEWFYILYKALRPAIQGLGGDLFSTGFSDIVIVYGLPGLAHGLFAAALCLIIWRRVADRSGTKKAARTRKR